MSVVIVTGSAGLIGSETCKKFHAEGFDVVGIDNDMRARFFGPEASTAATRERLQASLKNYTHEDLDIRDREAMEGLFRRLGSDIKAVIHTAAQPSHDWAARDPHTDFGVNAVGTLNLLEATRQHSAEAVFIFTSTNKVYGDTPNRLPLIELENRYDIDPSHPYHAGIDETMSIDQTKHSLFGASKAAADLLVQEYGVYFGMKSACFRGGCLTGPAHAGTELHGFLAYLMKCTAKLQGQAGARQHPQRRPRQRVLGVLQSPPGRRGLQHRRQPAFLLLDAAGDRSLRAHQRPQARLDVRRRQPRRRPYLVDQQRAQVPEPLPAVAVPLRHGRHSARDPRRPRRRRRRPRAADRTRDGVRTRAGGRAA